MNKKYKILIHVLVITILIVLCITIFNIFTRRNKKIGNVEYQKVSTYSLGMRQRLGIAEAIINDPKLLILDEPTNGLDIEGIIEIRNLIKELTKTGIAILISSHNLTEIENVCNRIIAIKKGEIVANDTLQNFKMFEGQEL
ncbi:MAG: ATP-binding cassette domain-containing protein, partial [Clostridia bacterium]|nr:ATP-binding cassette domain-containing protein [Clostridia bacterium]